MKTALTILFVMFGGFVFAGECPMHAEHMKMEARGDQRMGFDHTKTTHHFAVTNDGGTISITANNSKDAPSQDAIRRHLAQIAFDFSAGDFSSPIFIHQTNPPGADAMKKMKQDISYKYEEVKNGGRVVIQSKNASAVAAVHDFLKFQIEEHHTGDIAKASN